MEISFFLANLDNPSIIKNILAVAVLVVGVVGAFVGPDVQNVFKELIWHWQSYKTYLQL